MVNQPNKFRVSLHFNMDTRTKSYLSIACIATLGIVISTAVAHFKCDEAFSPTGDDDSSAIAFDNDMHTQGSTINSKSRNKSLALESELREYLSEVRSTFKDLLILLLISA